MKTRQLILLLFSFVLISIVTLSGYTQESIKITPELQVHLNTVSDTTLVPVLIVFHDARKWSAAELRNLDQMPLEARQNFVVAEIKNFCRKSVCECFTNFRERKSLE